MRRGASEKERIAVSGFYRRRFIPFRMRRFSSVRSFSNSSKTFSTTCYHGAGPNPSRMGGGIHGSFLQQLSRLLAAAAPIVLPALPISSLELNLRRRGVALAKEGCLKVAVKP